jgi:phosphatidylcholine synthase
MTQSSPGSTSGSGVGTSEYTARHVRVAWGVHVFTCVGVFVGYLGTNAVIQGRARGAIIWLIVALVLDGIDGPVARSIPFLNGHSLDLIIDFYTCTILPVSFLDRFDMVPDHTTAPTCFAILVSGALWMSRTDQETPDRWFRGFPAEWNMIIPTMFLLRANPWVTLVVCAVFVALTLSKVQFAHPVSVAEGRPAALVFMTLWLGSMLWLAIIQRDVLWLRIILGVAPMWTVFVAIRRTIYVQRHPEASLPVVTHPN